MVRTLIRYCRAYRRLYHFHSHKHIYLYFDRDCCIPAGICARSNAPFSPPLESRVTPRPRASIKERKEIKEGKCHVCMQWVPLQGTKDVEVMVKEIFW